MAEKSDTKADNIERNPGGPFSIVEKAKKMQFLLKNMYQNYIWNPTTTDLHMFSIYSTVFGNIEEALAKGKPFHFYITPSFLSLLDFTPNTKEQDETFEYLFRNRQRIEIPADIHEELDEGLTCYYNYSAATESIMTKHETEDRLFHYFANIAKYWDQLDENDNRYNKIFRPA